MKNFDKAAAGITAVIFLAFIGWLSLSIAFPMIMGPINMTIMIGTLLYMTYSGVRLIRHTNKLDKLDKE